MAGNPNRAMPITSNASLFQGEMRRRSSRIASRVVEGGGRPTRGGIIRPRQNRPVTRNDDTPFEVQGEEEGAEEGGGEEEEQEAPAPRRRRTMASNGTDYNAASPSRAAYPFTGLSASSAPAVQLAVAGPAQLIIVDQARQSIAIQPQWFEEGGFWGYIIPEGAHLRFIQPKNDAEHDVMMNAAAAATLAAPGRLEQASRHAEPRGGGIASSSGVGNDRTGFTRQITNPALTGYMSGRRMPGTTEAEAGERTMQLD